MALRAQLEALLRNALTAAERGWHVFPLRPGDKRPAFPDHDVEHCTGRDPRCVKAGGHLGFEPRATVDPDRIRWAWSRVPYNIGIACGPSCLLVVDLDKPKPDTVRPQRWQVPGVADGFDVFAALCEEAGQTLPVDTYTVTTGRGGTHLYYRHPDLPGGVELRNTSGEHGNGLGWLIDTRAHGGYVVGAGSVVDGRAYTVALDTGVGPTPGWIGERLRPAPLPPQRPVLVTLGAGRRAAYLDKAVQRSLDAIANHKPDTLNTTLYGASVALGQLVAGGELDAAETENLLLDAAVRAKHPPAGARKTIRSGFRAGARRPRSVAA